jgi:hypothetical protein
VRPYPLLLTWRHPGAPPVLAGNTLPPMNHRRATGECATTPSRARSARGHHANMRVARACCSGPRRPFALLGRAARPGPSPLFDRPRVAGRCAPWAVASGWFQPSTVRLFFKYFSIVLNSKNCFKLQKFVETCRNVQQLQNKFCMNPIEPLITVGLTKLTFTR